VPDGQSVHTVNPTAYWPIVQLVHEDSPAAEMDPAAHFVHVDCPWELNSPAEHCTQTLAPHVGPTDPDGHGWHWERPVELLKVPGSHNRQRVNPVSLA